MHSANAMTGLSQERQGEYRPVITYDRKPLKSATVVTGAHKMRCCPKMAARQVPRSV